MAEAIETLQRWTDSGARWRVRQHAGDRVIVELITCTGDEVVERLVSDDPALIRWLGARRSSDDPTGHID